MPTLATENILGAFVNFPDSEGNRYQGTIVAVWLVTERRDLNGSIRVTIACSDRTYRDAWLSNCQHGAIVKPKEPQGGI